jgi:hypothetical protein
MSRLIYFEILLSIFELNTHRFHRLLRAYRFAGYIDNG